MERFGRLVEDGGRLVSRQNEPVGFWLTIATGLLWFLLGTFILAFSIPGLVSTAAFAAPVSQGDETRHRSHLAVSKDMALARCIGKAYAAYPAVKADAAGATGGYFELGAFDLDRGGESVEALIDRYLSRDYGAIEGPAVKLDLMKCIDLYHSRELETLGRRYVARPQQSYATDNPGRCGHAVESRLHAMIRTWRTRDKAMLAQIGGPSDA